VKKKKKKKKYKKPLINPNQYKYDVHYSLLKVDLLSRDRIREEDQIVQFKHVQVDEVKMFGHFALLCIHTFLLYLCPVCEVQPFTVLRIKQVVGQPEKDHQNGRKHPAGDMQSQCIRITKDVKVEAIWGIHRSETATTEQRAFPADS